MKAKISPDGLPDRRLTTCARTTSLNVLLLVLIPRRLRWGIFFAVNALRTLSARLPPLSSFPHNYAASQGFVTSHCLTDRRSNPPRACSALAFCMAQIASPPPVLCPKYDAGPNGHASFVLSHPACESSYIWTASAGRGTRCKAEVNLEFCRQKQIPLQGFTIGDFQAISIFCEHLPMS